jgi:hypothetical protein
MRNILHAMFFLVLVSYLGNCSTIQEYIKISKNYQDVCPLFGENNIEELSISNLEGDKIIIKTFSERKVRIEFAHLIQLNYIDYSKLKNVLSDFEIVCGDKYSVRKEYLISFINKKKKKYEELKKQEEDRKKISENNYNNILKLIKSGMCVDPKETMESYNSVENHFSENQKIEYKNYLSMCLQKEFDQLIKNNNCKDIYEYEHYHLINEYNDALNSCIEKKLSKVVLKEYPFMKSFLSNEVIFAGVDGRPSGYKLIDLFNMSYLFINKDTSYKILNNEFEIEKYSENKFSIHFMIDRQSLKIHFEYKNKILYCKSIEAGYETNPNGWMNISKQIFQKLSQYPISERIDWKIIGEKEE